MTRQGYIQLHLLMAWLSMAAFSLGSIQVIVPRPEHVPATCYLQVLCTFLYGFALGPLFPGAILVAEARKARPIAVFGRRSSRQSLWMVVARALRWLAQPWETPGDLLRAFLLHGLRRWSCPC